MVGSVGLDWFSVAFGVVLVGCGSVDAVRVRLGGGVLETAT